MIIDAGVLVAVDRGDRRALDFLEAARTTKTALHTTHPVLAQVWRDGPRQAGLARALAILTLHPLDNGRAVGRLLAEADTSDVVDAHLVLTATRLGHDVLTGDTDDLSMLAACLGPIAPTVHAWP